MMTFLRLNPDYKQQVLLFAYQKWKCKVIVKTFQFPSNIYVNLTTLREVLSLTQRPHFWQKSSDFYHLSNIQEEGKSCIQWWKAL